MVCFSHVFERNSFGYLNSLLLFILFSEDWREGDGGEGTCDWESAMPLEFSEGAMNPITIVMAL